MEPDRPAFRAVGPLPPTAVWTGQQILVWGGYRGPGVRAADTGGLYCSQPGPAIFADGFESGNLSFWSSSVP